jgi:hypothetical protein
MKSQKERKVNKIIKKFIFSRRSNIFSENMNLEKKIEKTTLQVKLEIDYSNFAGFSV